MDGDRRYEVSALGYLAARAAADAARERVIQAARAFIGATNEDGSMTALYALSDAVAALDACAADEVDEAQP